jgi:hypothetical protein
MGLTNFLFFRPGFSLSVLEARLRIYKLPFQIR